MSKFSARFLALISTSLVAAVATATAQDADLPAVRKPVVIAEALAGKLVKLQDDKLVDHELDPETAIRYFVLYYSAGWSPTCKTFTPALIEFYKKQKTAGVDFEIIFVSTDDNEKLMEQYVLDTKMPWPALRFADKDGVEFVKDAAGRGVPCLAVLDSRGLILAHSYKRRKEYLGAEKTLEEFASMIADLEADGKKAEGAKE